MPKALLPSCQSLRVFEAAARHLNFTRAADEIHLTQGAVSQQIKLLEDRLQTRLFRRSKRHLSLTKSGERLYPPVRALLAQLHLLLDLAQASSDTESLVIYAPHCIASKWLAHRLPEFQAQNPNIRIRVRSAPVTPDLLCEEDSIAITLAEGETSSSVHSEYLGRDTVFPVCSPQILGKNKKNIKVDDLHNFRLLHVGGAERDSCCCDWSLWTGHFNQVDTTPSRTLCFTHCAMALEAASAGHGFALARGLTVEKELRLGLLVKPFEQEIASPTPYYCLCPKESLNQGKIVAFRQWLSSNLLCSDESGTLPHHESCEIASDILGLDESNRRLTETPPNHKRRNGHAV